MKFQYRLQSKEFFHPFHRNPENFLSSLINTAKFKTGDVYFIFIVINIICLVPTAAFQQLQSVLLSPFVTSAVDSWSCYRELKRLKLIISPSHFKGVSGN